MARRVDRAHRGHPWPRYRTALFLAGLAAIGIALLSPIDTLSDDLATVHMVQHMLLMLVAPPLLAASGIVTLALRASSRRTRERWLLPFLHSRLVTAISFPLVGWLAFAGVLWGTHYTAIYNLALLDPTVHVLEHLAYLVAASLFWWPVFSPDPTRWRMTPPAKLLYVLLQMPHMSFLAVSVLDAPRLLYDAYANRSLAFGINPLADQQTSAAVMWISGDLMLALAMGVVLYQWMRQEEAEAVRVDARLDREAERRSRAAAVVPEDPDAT